VAAILFGGAFLLGAGTLKDLALALLVGIAVGTYSSIFIATPVVAQLKEREPEMQALAKRVAARGGEYVSSPVGPPLTVAATAATTTGAAAPNAQRSQPKRQSRSRR
jgi:preprotein translocase subunit SecF